MLRKRYWHMSMATGLILVSSALTASSAGQDQPAFSEFAFSFLVGTHDSAPNVDLGDTDERSAAPQALVAGQVVRTSDILKGLHRATTTTSGGARDGHAFVNAQLIVRLENISNGEVVEKLVALCPTLDFEQNEGAPFEEEVSCGENRIAYSVTDQGIVVTKDGEIALSYDLSAGAYSLNGVPFLVN
jgi:hypothetical protein